jgi:hypothetical protein
MDIYSNILYVKEAFAALSHLAQRAALTNKYRPETACIIGNYYSLKGQHEKVRSLSVSRRGRDVGKCIAVVHPHSTAGAKLLPRLSCTSGER